jgi:hypothetical protein
MRVYDLTRSSAKFEKFSNLNLPLAGIYLLARPSTSDEARDEVIARAEAGEPMSVAEIGTAIAGSKATEDEDEDEDEPESETETKDEPETEQPRRRTKLDRELDAGAFNRLGDERARNEDLAEKLRAAEIKIAGLESEVEDLKAERDQLRARVAELESAIATRAAAEKPKRGRGRPPGSPNKPKAPVEVADAITSALAPATPAPIGVREPMPEFLRRAMP